MSNSLVHQIENNWDEIKGKIKRRWGKLTDDDLEEMDGSYDEFTAKLEKLYGYTQDEIEDKITIFAEKLNLKNIKSVADDVQSKISESVSHLWDVFKDKSNDLQDGVYCYIKGNPYRSAGIVSAALAVGIMVAKCLKKSN